MKGKLSRALARLKSIERLIAASDQLNLGPHTESLLREIGKHRDEIEEIVTEVHGGHVKNPEIRIAMNCVRNAESAKQLYEIYRSARLDVFEYKLTAELGWRDHLAFSLIKTPFAYYEDKDNDCIVFTQFKPGIAATL